MLWILFQIHFKFRDFFPEVRCVSTAGDAGKNLALLVSTVGGGTLRNIMRFD